MIVSIRSLALASVVMFSGCACNETASDTPAHCDEARWRLEWPENGLPAMGTPPEWMLTREIPFEQPEGEAANTHYWLPWDFNRRQAYYVRGSDSVFLRVRFMSGTAYESTGLARLRIFVEDQPISVINEGDDVAEVTAPLIDGLADVMVEIPAEHFRAGLNHVSVYARYDYGRVSLVREYDDFWSFTVAKDTADGVVSLPETAGLGEGEFLPGYATTATFVHADGSSRQLHRFNEAPDARTSIPVTLRLQADPRDDGCEGPVSGPRVNRFAVVAFLDGESVPIGDHDRIIARLPPGVQRTIEFALPLPRDGVEHRFEIVALNGLGKTARLTGGDSYPPWDSTGYLVSVVRWGP